MTQPEKVNPRDWDKLRSEVRNAAPFPHFCLDNFFEQEFAESVAQAFPSYDEARHLGREFTTVNEKRKIQITEAASFAPAVAKMNQILAAPETLSLFSSLFDIPDLLADDRLTGGGIHEMAPRGRLDVHVDFNYVADRQWHRRLNFLVYFNHDWQKEWGGELELWDANVSQCVKSIPPAFNRCVVFTTTDVSFHGVNAIRCPEGRARRSFAAYYYTTAAPAHWTGEQHPTLFRARPDELVKGNVLMPLERAGQQVESAIRSIRTGLKKISGR